MANIHAYIELAGDQPAESSLEALGEGRRIASALGATLHAVVACAIPPRGADGLIETLGRHGADKVVLVSAPELAGPLLHATHGPAVAAACEKAPPALVLLAATAGGRDLAPRLAARLGAAYLAEASVEYGARGELLLSRIVYTGAFRRRLQADELERPVVATLAPGSYARATGDDEAEVVLVPPPAAPAAPPIEEIERRADPDRAVDTARVVVTAGAGVSKDAWALVQALARALGGEAAVTRGGVLGGLAPAEREVGIGGRLVSPRLYVACGASGSSAHLAGVGADAEIVAVNPDPRAPIFQAAAYGIVGTVEEVLPKLLAALEATRPS